MSQDYRQFPLGSNPFLLIKLKFWFTPSAFFPVTSNNGTLSLSSSSYSVSILVPPSKYHTVPCWYRFLKLCRCEELTLPSSSPSVLCPLSHGFPFHLPPQRICMCCIHPVVWRHQHQYYHCPTSSLN